MGNFYKNVTLRGPSREGVISALEQLGRVAYVSPTRDGFTTVFDLDADEVDDPSELGDLALTLSENLRCVSLAAAVYDDDVLLLGVYSSGKQEGEYNSSGSSGLGAFSLARECGSRWRAPLVWLILALPHVAILFESCRHGLLLWALGIPSWGYATGYKYIQRGEPPPDAPAEALRHVGQPRSWKPRITR